MKELRDRGVTITSVASGIATLTVTALVALRDRSGATLDDGLSVPALVVTILSLLLVMVASAVLWAPLAYGTRVDGRGVADWVERHSFSAAEVYLEVAVQLEVAGDRNRVGLRFRHDWFRVGLFALAIEVFSAGLLIWSFTS